MAQNLRKKVLLMGKVCAPRIFAQQAFFPRTACLKHHVLFFTLLIFLACEWQDVHALSRVCKLPCQRYVTFGAYDERGARSCKVSEQFR